MSAEAIAEVQQQLRTLDEDRQKPKEYKLLVYPRAKTWDLEEKVVERMQLFGGMNIYATDKCAWLKCYCKSVETASDAAAARRIVVEGETFCIVQCWY
jgi:hypothetical protein